MIKFLTAASAFLMMIVLVSCNPEGDLTTYDCATTAPTYTVIVKPILDAKCATSGCHNASSAKDGIDLSTYELCKTESQKDRFRGCIQHITGYEAMPEGGAKLDETTVQIISCWVQNGSPE